MNRLNNDKLPTPSFFNFATSGGPSGDTSMVYSSANFHRTENNSNIEITIPAGSELGDSSIWMSPNVYIPNSTFNVTKPISEVSFPNNRDVKIHSALTFSHDIIIQYKLTKTDDTNYVNRRELRCFLVKDDGTTVYESVVHASAQPSSGSHDYLFLRGYITHNADDVVRVKMNIIQDDKKSGKSDTKLTIFRISWNILGVKESEDEEGDNEEGDNDNDSIPT